MKKLLLIVSSVIFAVALNAQTSIQVQTHKVVAADEQFNVTFIIEGESKTTDFAWSPGNDFQLLWGPQQGRSTNMQIVNGNMTKTVQTTYSYVLKPQRAGTFVIPRAVAKVKGKEIYSESVTIEVVASEDSSTNNASSQSQSGTSSQPQQGSASSVDNGDLFLTMELDRRNVVVGEPIIAVIKLYQRVNIAGFESAQFPDFNGFWSQELEAPTNIEFSRSTYNGQIYNSALLRKVVLIPQQQGTLTIDPAELVCIVNVRVASTGSSIFDGFFDNYTTVRRKVTSKPVKVNVSALPSGAPSSFYGGVGRFSVSAKISKDSLKTHEAASLSVTVSGSGNISLLETPKVNFPPDMEVYDTKVSDRITSGGTSGSKTYEFPFIPRSYGDFTIEPIQYTYYDINSGKYVTLSTEPVHFYVEKGKETEGGSPLISSVSQKDVRNLGSDIRFINVKDGSFAPKGYFFVNSGLYWLCVVLIFLLALAGWAVLNRISARRADVAGSKNRKATRTALKRLRLAGTLLKQNLYTAFYEELHKALLGFVSDKLNVPASELSKENIASIMADGNVDPALTEEFLGLLDACEFARYSPSAGNEAMSAHYASALNVISSMDSNMKSKKKASVKAVCVAALLMFLPFAADAQTQYVDSLWNASNELYAQGQWQEALKGYRMIVDSSLESAPLWCNMGDAWYKDGNLAQAIVCYERALKADPSYADARYNLEFLNSQIQDRIESVPEMIFITWLRKLCYVMDSDQWAVLSLIFLFLALASAVLFLVGRSTAARRTGFFVGIAFMLLAVGAFSFSNTQKREYMKADSAIVVSAVSSVKSSPSSGVAKDLFVLHEGTKVRIIDSVGNWKNIELADGRQGWIPSSDLEII